MAYQNVGTPRFYIDFPSYQNSAGLGLHSSIISSLSQDFFTLNPITPKDFYGVNNFQHQFINFGGEDSIKCYQVYNNDKMFLAILNHNLGDNCGLSLRDEEFGGTQLSEVDYVLNHMRIGLATKGSSICTYKQVDNSTAGLTITINDNTEGTYNQISIGSINFGSYYDMPHSPDLNITMTIENDGFDTITTSGGSHLNNVRYNGAPMWERVNGTQVPPWTIGEPTTVGRRRGRRVWSLSFSQISSKDLFASNYMSNTYINNPQDSSNDAYNDNEDLVTDRSEFEYTLGNDDSFVAQVLNRVGNGQRFIFQPDNNNNNPDQFAICQLDQDSLVIKQVANSVYDFSLKIREVW